VIVVAEMGWDAGGMGEEIEMDILYVLVALLQFMIFF